MSKFIIFRDAAETLAVKEKYITAIMKTRENGYFQGFVYTKTEDCLQVNENSFNEIMTQIEHEISENEFIYTHLKEFERCLYVRAELIESVMAHENFSCIRFKTGYEAPIHYDEAKQIIDFLETHSAHIIEKEEMRYKEKLERKMRKAKLETLEGLHDLRNEILSDMEHDKKELSKLDLLIAEKMPKSA